jgi:hypothetical protein
MIQHVPQLNSLLGTLTSEGPDPFGTPLRRVVSSELLCEGGSLYRSDAVAAHDRLTGSEGSEIRLRLVVLASACVLLFLPRRIFHGGLRRESLPLSPYHVGDGGEFDRAPASCRGVGEASQGPAGQPNRRSHAKYRHAFQRPGRTQVPCRRPIASTLPVDLRARAGHGSDSGALRSERCATELCERPRRPRRARGDAGTWARPGTHDTGPTRLARVDRSRHCLAWSLCAFCAGTAPHVRHSSHAKLA